MNFALMFILKCLAVFVSIMFLILSVIFAIIGTILRFPGTLVIRLSNCLFGIGNKIAQWLILNKVKEALKTVKKSQ